MMRKKDTKQTSLGNRILQFFKQHYVIILLTVLFLLFLFFHFYQLEERASWGWDQVDVAWNARKILLNHEYPLIGMVAKGNTGFHIGPLYYYLAASFYKATDMHPIASPFLATFSAIIGFFVIYFVVKNIFSKNIALIAVAITTFSSFVIQYDRIQWPVNFIVPISALIFYALYKIVTGSPRFLLLLAFMIGLSLHVHFTSVYYFVLVFFALPFFPRSKEMFKYILYAIPIFIVFIIPFFLVGGQVGGTVAGYIQNSYHGIHLRRIVQLTHDAFIEFQALLFFKPFSYISFLFLPFFLFVYLYKQVTRERLLLCYLAGLWFLVPWIAFSTYSGEITNYYFFMTRPVAIMILAFLTYKAIIANKILAVAVVAFWAIFVTVNMQEFFRSPSNELAIAKGKAIERIQKNDQTEEYLNIPEAYWQWYLQKYKEKK